MKKGRKGKNIVSTEQVIEHLSTAKKQGRTLLSMAKHFGTTKDRIKRALGKASREWHSVDLPAGTTVYVIRKYKDHEVKRLHSRMSISIQQ